MKKVLLIRLDKIGDLICTMCVDQVPFLKDCEVTWVIAKGLSFVPEHASPRRSYLELKKQEWRESLPALRDFLKKFRPDVAVSFQAPWWVHYALWLENVPVRAGVQSQWHSFLFLNRGLRQKRSQAVQHEADYNLDLLCHAFQQKDKPLPTPVLKLQAPPAQDLLTKYQLRPKAYVVVHPGMAGSALNWDTTHYIAVIESILSETKVVLTGTAMDEPWLRDIKEQFKNSTQVLCLQNQLSPSELLAVLGA
ncbi:MAG: glycosyltransferase family 9 protein, partial [Bdellovibrio sp.]